MACQLGDVGADLVIASYAAAEIDAADLDRFAAELWRATAQMLAIIEPGTPAGYRRILQMRATLTGSGALVAAPCPHEHACPLVAPDWCHFARRLPRSRDHRVAKGAQLAFEDEKFAYVVLSRAEPCRIDARALAPPRIGKAAIESKLCTATGVVADVAERRQKDGYKQRKAWRWGDAVTR